MLKSYVTECMIKAREGEGHLFEQTAEGAVLARLRGYAVIPAEDYEALVRAQQNLERIGFTLSETPNVSGGESLRFYRLRIRRLQT